MYSFKDLTGKRFGRLVVIERDYNAQKEQGTNAVCWKCRCDCGNIVVKRSPNLLNGKSKSCGCLRDEIGNKPFVYNEGQIITINGSNFLVEESFRRKRNGSAIKDKMYRLKCLRCGETNFILESTAMQKVGSCKACGSGRSFGEKFFYWVLKQCGVDFDIEYSPSWAGKYRYDFSFSQNGSDYLIEIDGGQHYGKGYKGILRGRKQSERVEEYDKDKDFLSQQNGFILIRIKTSGERGMYFVNNIKNTILSDLFDLSIVDWKFCYEMSISEKTRKICTLWNEGHRSCPEIASILGIHENYPSKVLIRCSEMGLCDYDPALQKYLGQSKKGKNGKPIICLDNMMEFESANECSRQSDTVFGIHLTSGGITRVCRGERNAYKGFHFQFI